MSKKLLQELVSKDKEVEKLNKDIIEMLEARIKELEDGIKDACSRWVVNIDGQLIGNSIIENNSNILPADIPIAKRWINANLIQGLINGEGKQ